MRSFSFTEFFRRALPFFATLVIGVFIASFFVDLSKPRFGRGARKHQEIQRLRIENEELKNENLRLRNQLESLDLNIDHPTEPAFEREWPGTAIDGLPAPPPVVKRVR